MGAGGDDKKTGSGSASPTNADVSSRSSATGGDRPGKQYGMESYMPEYQKLPDEVTHSKPFKQAKKAYGPSAHEIQWGPNIFTTYVDTNNPFYFRTPKDIKDAPAHVPQNPINIELHLRDERQRLTGMTKAEREWRGKFILDQNLHPDEPFFIEEAQVQLNPWRRLYRWPWDTFAKKFLYPKFGIKRGHFIRQSVPKYILAFIAVETFYYYAKYNQSTWDDSFRICTLTPNPCFAKRDEIDALHPGLIEKAYPVFKTPDDFFGYGFKDRNIYLDLGESKRPW